MIWVITIALWLFLSLFDFILVPVVFFGLLYIIASITIHAFEVM